MTRVMAGSDRAKQVLTERYNVLFLCTGNSARSVMAEALLARWGEPRFHSFSAGSHPKAAPHPMTLATLEEEGYDTHAFRSKSWQEFARPDSPALDLVITVCGNALAETEEGACPVWTGPVAHRVHWGVEDPAACEGDQAEVRRVFREIYGQLEERVRMLVDLDFDALTPPERQVRLEEIGRI